ncbi:voltage-gated potassium channel subunit beta-2 [Egretta garzetta]|uniref:voltage-gated potassium channel subunit beta-2 n=1 Tax=Egretta garzetta TaxID=188379 RepID=UPI00163CCB68|nr:voltage-gated potassium channel subunit beta-2 [Egretta garzetta]
MYPESTTDSPARLSLRQTGSPGMIYRNLGKSGLRVSCLGLGKCRALPQPRGSPRPTVLARSSRALRRMAEQLMTLAYDNGINLFDTAEAYAAGKARGALQVPPPVTLSPCRRSSLVITTKIFWGGKAETERGLSRKHIIEGFAGLRRQGMSPTQASRNWVAQPASWGVQRQGARVEAASAAQPCASSRVRQGHDPDSQRHLPQVLPKLSSSIVHEIDSILGNKPYSKKDYRS